MTSNSSDPCPADDNLCIIRVHQQGVIVVPTLLFFGTLITLVPLFILRYRAERRRTRVTVPQRYNNNASHRHTKRNNHRPQLQGIDAPPGIDPLEHEEVPMSVQHVQQNLRPSPAADPHLPTRGHHGGFSHVSALPVTFPVQNQDPVSLYRARMDHRDVVLRVLKETSNNIEKQNFLGFASFVSGLGPHPSLPVLMGVISVQSPLVMVVEELQHRDLLGYLWRCRQDNPGSESLCEMTEKRIFIMAGQVASALDYLHTQRCVHGNVGARSVLIGGELTAKLWGLGPVYRRRTQAGSPGELEDVEMRKWQAPEVLSRRIYSPSSDVWSFGILLYEMVTLGDPPFAQIMATELLQQLQRGKHLKRPATCSTSLYSIIRSCCQFNPQQRLSMAELIRKLRAGEQSANGRTVLRVPEPMIFEKYLREAGYGEAYNYAVL